MLSQVFERTKCPCLRGGQELLSAKHRTDTKNKQKMPNYRRTHAVNQRLNERLVGCWQLECLLDIWCLKLIWFRSDPTVTEIIGNSQEASIGKAFLRRSARGYLCGAPGSSRASFNRCELPCMPVIARPDQLHSSAC